MQAFLKYFLLSRCYFLAVRWTTVLSVVEPGGRAADPKPILRTHPPRSLLPINSGSSIHNTQTQTTTQHRKRPCSGLVAHAPVVPEVCLTTFLFNIILIIGYYAPLTISVLSLGMPVQQVRGQTPGQAACVPIVAHVLMKYLNRSGGEATFGNNWVFVRHLYPAKTGKWA